MEFEQLTDREREAVLAAAVWYAKYHESIIAATADDRTAMAIDRRDRFRELYDGLEKLGVRIARPDALGAAA